MGFSDSAYFCWTICAAHLWRNLDAVLGYKVFVKLLCLICRSVLDGNTTF